MKRSSRQLDSKWVGRLFILVGSIFFIVGGFLLWGAYDFMQTAQRTTGVVLSVDRIVTRDSDGTSVTYSPTFRYADLSGALHESSPSLRSSAYNFPIGSEVEILFDPAQPTTIRVDGFFSTWGFPGAFAAFGALFIVIGAVASWKIRGGGGTPRTTTDGAERETFDEPTVRRR